MQNSLLRFAERFAVPDNDSFTYPLESGKRLRTLWPESRQATSLATGDKQERVRRELWQSSW